MTREDLSIQGAKVTPSFLDNVRTQSGSMPRFASFNERGVMGRFFTLTDVLAAT